MWDNLILKAVIAIPAALSMWSSAVGAEIDFESLSGEELVKLLVSPNAEPDGIRPGPKGRSKPPEGYDTKAQDIIYRAWNELLKRDESVIQALLEHSDDKRYSVTEEGGLGLTNLTVAGACFRILHAKLELAPGFTRRPGLPSYVYKVIARDPKRWAKSHVNKTLAQLQKKSAKWFLDQELAPDIPQDAADKIRAHVQSGLREIKKSDTPIMPAPHKPIHRF